MLKILIQEKYLELGLIMPGFHAPNFNFDIEKEFACMDKKEARKIKRKFRKIVRKAKKQRHKIFNESRTRKGWEKHFNNSPPPKIIRNFLADQRIKEYNKSCGFGIDIKNPVYVFKKKMAAHDFIFRSILES